MYLFEVVPQEFGVSRPILFPVYWLIDCVQARRNKRHHLEEEEEPTDSDATIELEMKHIETI
jgi:hypothetical protein